MLQSLVAAPCLVAAAAASPARRSSDLRVAVIGLGGRGRAHVNGIGPSVVAVCDVDSRRLHDVAAMASNSSSRRIKAVTDFRRILDDSSIDAVSIATPNHSHALLATLAAQSGKSVYVEKPVCHTVWEGRQIVAAAKNYRQIIQSGTQCRSNPGLAEAVKWVQAGNLGKIRYVVGTCYKPRMSIGLLSHPLEIPDSVDYDLWCGPAKQRDLFRPKFHYDWHWTYDTGNGDMGNQGVHQLDIARWFLGCNSYPTRVLSIGGRLGYRDAGSTPNTQVAYFEYPEGPIVFETRGLPRSKHARSSWPDSMDSYRGSQIGVVVQCELGHVLIPSYTEAIAFDRDSNIILKWSGEGDHFGNWLNAVERQDDSLLSADIEQGHLSAAACHLATISHRLGESSVPEEIAAIIAGNDLLSDAFERMASHLRANHIDLADEQNRLCLGRWVAYDSALNNCAGDDEASHMLRSKSRAQFEVPQLI